MLFSLVADFSVVLLPLVIFALFKVPEKDNNTLILQILMAVQFLLLHLDDFVVNFSRFSNLRVNYRFFTASLLETQMPLIICLAAIYSSSNPPNRDYQLVSEDSGNIRFDSYRRRANGWGLTVVAVLGLTIFSDFPFLYRGAVSVMMVLSGIIHVAVAAKEQLRQKDESNPEESSEVKEDKDK